MYSSTLDTFKTLFRCWKCCTHAQSVTRDAGTLRCAEEGAVGVEALRNATGPWLACTREGAIVELRPVSAGDYAVLAGLEAVMARSELTRPLSGASHSAYGFAVEAGAGGKGALAAAMAGAVPDCKHRSLDSFDLSTGCVVVSQ